MTATLTAFTFLSCAIGRAGAIEMCDDSVFRTQMGLTVEAWVQPYAYTAWGRQAIVAAGAAGKCKPPQ